MKNTIIDAGPLIALFDRNDRYHPQVVDFIEDYSGSFLTTWVVVGEVSHMLRFNVQVQIDFLEWIYQSGMEVIHIPHDKILRIIELSKKYSDRPMDLADASLVVLAEMMNIKDIVTIDSDYYIYRTIYKQSLNNLLQV